MNGYNRLHGLIFGRPGLDSNSSADDPSAIGGRDRSMNRPRPRRGRGTAGLAGRIRCTPLPMIGGVDRFKEEHRMTTQPSAPEVRQELVARIRQEIQAGTYDTAEKFEAALERLTAQLDDE